MRLVLTLVVLVASCAAPARPPAQPTRPAPPPDLASPAGIERALLRATVDADDAALERALSALRAWTRDDDVAALARAVELRCLALRVSDDDAWLDAARADLQALLARLPAAPSGEETGAAVVALLRLFDVTGDELLRADALARGEALSRHAPREPGGPARLAACVALLEATGDERWLERARAAIGALPERSAVAARALLRLEAVTADPDWGDVAGVWLRDVAPGPEGDLAKDERALLAMRVNVTGPPGDPRYDALLRAARRCCPPRAVVVLRPSGEGYPDLGRAAVFLSFVCPGSSWWTSAPIEDPAALRGAVDAHLR
ncbi:MAG: hypothetical protein KF878_19050 [Planctomycetes bacterium]|nr:hypothetical protein [Planctomycetota bacterium]